MNIPRVLQKIFKRFFFHPRVFNGILSVSKFYNELIFISHFYFTAKKLNFNFLDERIRRHWKVMKWRCLHIDNLIKIILLTFRHYDEEGNKNYWWTNNTISQFLNRLSCTDDNFIIKDNLIVLLCRLIFTL